MKRSVEDRTILDKFAEDFAKVVERHTKYIIVSGFVAIAHGRVRGTEDIDMILQKIDKNEFAMMHKDLVKAGFECIQSADAEMIFDEYLASGLSVRYVRKGAFVPDMEIKFAKNHLDQEQIEKRAKLPLTGMDIYFPSIESAIAFKEELLRAEKDIEDAKHLRLVYSETLDEKEISRIKKEIRRRAK